MASAPIRDPVADHLLMRHAVQRLYGLDHLPTEAEMVEMSERRRPYRSLAVSYLFASGFEERP